MLAKPFTRTSLLGMAAGVGIAWSSAMHPLQAATDMALPTERIHQKPRRMRAKLTGK